MNVFARVAEQVVIEVTPDLREFRLEEVFEPELAAEFVACPPYVQPGWGYDGRNWLEPVAAPEQALEQLKFGLKSAVDVAAENERLKYITSGAGQALTYMQKSDEARRYLAADNPNAAEYPLLAAEVGITAPDIAAVAEVVSQAYAQWQQIGAAIEATRLGAKSAIDAAHTASDAQAVYDLVVWPAV